MKRANRTPIDADWPSHFREAFDRVTAAMSKKTREKYRTYFCAWLRFLEEHDLDSSAESFSGFQSCLERRKKPESVRDYIYCLARLIVEMALKEHPPEIVAGLTPIRNPRDVKAVRKPYPKGLHTMAWEDWPEGHKARWGAGVMKPEEIGTSPYKETRRRAREAMESGETAANRCGKEQDSGASPIRSARHPSEWTEATTKAARDTWSMWLKTAEKYHFDADDVSEETINRFIDSAEDRGVSCRTLVSYLQKLHQALAVMRPGEDWPYIRQLVRNYKLVMEPGADKLEKFVPLTELYALGLMLMAEAEESVPTVRSSVAYRDGLMIALLTQRPKRRRNIAEMRVGQELDLDEDGTPVGIATARTKSGESRYVSFPDLLKQAMTRYLTWWRPRLAKEDCDALWVAITGGPLGEYSIGQAISRRTRQNLGVNIAPHMFRTIFATWFGIQNPDLLEDVSEALDHKDRHSVTYYQATADSGFGAAQLNSALQAIKEQEAKDRKKRRRRHSKARRQMAET